MFSHFEMQGSPLETREAIELMDSFHMETEIKWLEAQELSTLMPYKDIFITLRRANRFCRASPDTDQIWYDKTLDSICNPENQVVNIGIVLNSILPSLGGSKIVFSPIFGFLGPSRKNEQYYVHENPEELSIDCVSTYNNFFIEPTTDGYFGLRPATTYLSHWDQQVWDNYHTRYVSVKLPEHRWALKAAGIHGAPIWEREVGNHLVSPPKIISYDRVLKPNDYNGPVLLRRSQIETATDISGSQDELWEQYKKNCSLLFTGDYFYWKRLSDLGKQHPTFFDDHIFSLLFLNPLQMTNEYYQRLGAELNKPLRLTNKHQNLVNTPAKSLVKL